MSGDIRKWFLKEHGSSQKSKEVSKSKESATPASKDNLRVTSKYFPTAEPEIVTPKGKRPSEGASADGPSPKKPKSSEKKNEKAAKASESDDFVEEAPTPKGRGRGRGGRATKSDAPKPAGRGRGGGGRGGYFGAPRATPPHKGEKEVPEGAEGALAGLTFVISGTLDSLEREEAEDLIKRHGGRVTSAVSRKTSFLLADEDIGGQKSLKAKDLGIPFITEDALFDKIRASKPKKNAAKPETRELLEPDTGLKMSTAQPKSAKAPQASPKPKVSPGSGIVEQETWPHKHRPKSPNDIIANQAIVKQLKDWLQQWDEHHLHSGSKSKGKRKAAASSSGNDKKAALLCGPPGIGKTTTARLVCMELGYEVIEVNASDSRGKAETKIQKGLGASTANGVKELISNEALGFSKRSKKKFALIMDEVDGMSAGDRGGVADLIASIKASKVPVICICNDRYSQKLKSLVNYCLLLSYRKPTKQQMAKRLQQIARSEGVNIDDIALEELAERTHGDMRLALNQLQYMSLQSKVLKFNDIKSYSTASAKDEDMSPFSAVDKLLGYDGGRLRMDERLDYAMSDMDLVPLIVQENYINYIPSNAGRDDSGTARLDSLAQAAASIADGDIVNVQIRRYRQWQLSQMGAFMSSIVPSSIMHGRREVFMPGERNFNRFGGWFGKNSTYGKNTRLLEDVHVHLLASRVCEPTREAVRLDYASLLVLKLTSPLHVMDKNEAVQAVLDVMEEYSLTQEDYETLKAVTKFQGHADPVDGIPAAVKSALTRGYSQRLQTHRVKSADLLPSLPGQKKASKKKVQPPAEEDELGTGDVEEATGDIEEADDDAEEEDREDSEALEALKNSTIEIVSAGDEQKSAGKRKAPSKSAKASTSKPAGKRKK